MESQFSHTNNELSIVLSGDLIGGVDAMKFAQSLRTELESKSVAGVSIDLKHVGFVNSSGLGMLLAARQSVLDNGAVLSMHAPGEQLNQLLEITKLKDILGVSA